MKSHGIGVFSCIISFLLSSLASAAVVEVNDNITTNTIWQAANVYHVNGEVHIQALLVIEPGTTVQFAYATGLWVDSGGTLFAAGRPGQPVTFEPDISFDPNNPYWGYYYHAACIEETASPATQIRYCNIRGAMAAIATLNIRLDTPIQNNSAFFCAWGFQEFGPHLTDVVNNQTYCSYYDGMDIHLQSEDGLWEFNTSDILIQNNTCDYSQYSGITVHGADNETNAGTVRLINNIASEAYCGLSLVDGYMQAFVLHTGYYGNYQDKNWAFDETNPVTATGLPFESGPGFFDLCYLNQSSPFINSGCGGVNKYDGEIYNGDISQLPQLLCSTTSLDNTTDTGIVDLGYHYPAFDQVNTGTVIPTPEDLNGDGVVDNADLAIFWSHYGQTASPGDINGDNITDLYDLRILRKLWGQTAFHPNIAASLNGDPDNVSDMAYLTVTGYSTNTTDAFFFMDGTLIGKLRAFRDGQGLGVDTPRYNNGEHQIKVVCLNNQGHITLSENVNLNFNNRLYCLTSTGSYQPGQNFQFQAFYDGSDNLSFSLTDVNDNVIWPSQPLSISTNSINMAIPQAALIDQIYLLCINETSSGQSSMQGMSSEGYRNWIKIISKKFNKDNITTPVVGLITLNDADVVKDDWACIAKVVSILKRYPNYIVLYNGFNGEAQNCIWENFSYFLHNANTLDIRYWYHAGHDGSEEHRDGYNQIYFTRSGIQIGGENIYSYVKKDFGETTPPWFFKDYNPIGIDYIYPDNSSRQKTILSQTSHYLSSGHSPFQIVFIDTCYSERYLVVYNAIPHGNQPIPHDLAYTLGMYSNYFQAYFGWEDKRWYNGWISTDDSDFVWDFWRRLGLMNSVGASWYDAGNAYDDANVFDRTHLISIGDPWTLWLWDY